MVERSRRAPVASCHSGAAGPAAAAGAPVVALVGAPNVGKTTLFNHVTGARRETGNWPGTSVAVGHGSWRLNAREIAVVDLPGAYSLDPMSPDEALTRSLLTEVDVAERPDVVVVVLDATALARSLYLLAQVRERGGRVVAALTMNDVAVARGVNVDADRLSTAVGARVVPVDPRRGEGLDRLSADIGRALAEPPPPALILDIASDPLAPGARLLSDDAEPGRPVAAGADVIEPDPLASADARFTWIDAAVSAAQQRDRAVHLTRSDRIDRVVTSPVGGAAVFLAAMWLVFQITTAVAAPLQGALGALLTGPVTSGVLALVGLVGLSDGVIGRFIVEGLLSGVGMLLTFVPLMALMFALLSILEDSGYMARAAVVTDRLMRLLRLPGRAFLPLVIGFGCNVPAVSGTRVLPDARHRLLTTLLVPFTSCSARLTVYVLVAGIFFPDHAGTVVFVMYLVSILFVVLVGLGLRSTVLRAMPNEPLLVDLPPYHLPIPRLVLRTSWTRLRGFLSTAGGLIVGTVSVVWLLQAIPVDGAARFGEVPVDGSVYAATARAAAPVFAPAGFGDWHTTSALLTGFVAKEAVISTWAQTYAAQRPAGTSPAGQTPGPATGTNSAGQAPSSAGPSPSSAGQAPNSAGQAPSSAGPSPSSKPAAPTTSGRTPASVSPATLGTDVREHFMVASGGHATAAAWAFLVFLLAYTPCVATLAAQRREIGLRWTAFGVLNQLVTAWLAAVVVFQVGRLVV